MFSSSIWIFISLFTWGSSQFSNYDHFILILSLKWIWYCLQQCPDMVTLGQQWLLPVSKPFPLAERHGKGYRYVWVSVSHTWCRQEKDSDSLSLLSIRFFLPDSCPIKIELYLFISIMYKNKKYDIIWKDSCSFI